MTLVTHRRLVAAVGTAGIAALATTAAANPGGTIFKAELTGYQEVPAISSPGSGTFAARALPNGQAIQYTLYFDGLQGNVTQAHIHVGQHGVSGGIAIWLCGTATNPGPAGTPTCVPGTNITGVVTAQSVVGPAGQLVAAGELEEVLQAMEAGVAYANVHSTSAPLGEIRGQIR
jgi:hypothetical protein